MENVNLEKNVRPVVQNNVVSDKNPGDKDVKNEVVKTVSSTNVDKQTDVKKVSKKRPSNNRYIKDFCVKKIDTILVKSLEKDLKLGGSIVDIKFIKNIPGVNDKLEFLYERFKNVENVRDLDVLFTDLKGLVKSLKIKFDNFFGGDVF